MRIPQYWLYIFLFTTAALFFLYKETQSPLSYDFAPQFDGNDYRLAYEYFTGQTTDYKVPFPFHSRIVVPWLAAQINSGDIISDFQWVNLLFALLATWMLFLLWRQLGFELKWFIVGFGWLLFHWTGMIRLNAFDPITVDMPLYVFQTLLIWFVIKRKFAWLLILAPIAILQKESFLGLTVCLLAYGWYHNRKRQDAFYNLKWMLTGLLLAVISLQTVNYLLPYDEKGKNSLVTLLYHAREVVLHPFELVRWLAAAFMAFGPFLVAGILKGAKRRHYDHRKNLLILFSVIYLLYGILAGGDMTRIIFLGFPFIMTWVMYELQELKAKQVFLLVLLALPLTYITQSIPDPAFEWERWQSWYPEFAPSQQVLLVLVYGMICTTIVWWQQRRSMS